MKEKFEIYPCQGIGTVGDYLVARPGDWPVFIQGAYHWSKDEAETIAKQLNEQRPTGLSRQEIACGSALI